MEAKRMTEFDNRHHELQSIVNGVIHHAPSREFTIDELIGALKAKLPESTPNGDVFYATELLRGTVCRLVLNGSIRKIDDEYYVIKEV